MKRLVSVVCLFLIMGLSWGVGAYDGWHLEKLLGEYVYEEEEQSRFGGYWASSFGGVIPNLILCESKASYTIDLGNSDTSDSTKFEDDSRMWVNFEMGYSLWQPAPNSDPSEWFEAKIKNLFGPQLIFDWDPLPLSLGYFSKFKGKIVLTDFGISDDEWFRHKEPDPNLDLEDHLEKYIFLYVCNEGPFKIDESTQKHMDSYTVPKKCTGCDLSDADLSDMDLGQSNLVEADLSGANLTGANLTGANMSRANLKAANLRGANLSGANLVLTILSGANLEGANLTGTDLSAVVVVFQEWILCNTTMPDGTINNTGC